MQRVYGEDLKRIQIEILDYVADFCEKNNISYWIDSGTLLGAIRHKGYIPWDDDIDLGMLRPDFDRFIASFNNCSSRYKAYSVENNPDFCYAFGKVLDTSTVLYEPDQRGNKLSINIDIFIYDNVPNIRCAKKLYDIRDFYRLLHENRIATNVPSGGAIRRTVVYAFRFFLSFFPRNYFIKKLVKNSKTYYHQDTEYVGNFTAYTRMICSKSVFNSFISTEFEGKYYRIPSGYDEWLRSFYGDYMQLPPKEKQVSHHKFEAYVESSEI